MRRCWICVVVVMAAFLTSNAVPPNVLFVYTDGQDFDTIHSLSNSDIQMPNLDKAARVESFPFPRPVSGDVSLRTP